MTNPHDESYEFDEMRMDDDGCPNCGWPYEPVKSHEVIKASKKAIRLARRHRNMIHAVVIGTVVIMVALEGWHRNDLSFLVLCIVTELVP